MTTHATRLVRFLLSFYALLVFASCGRPATIALSSDPGNSEKPSAPQKPVNPETPPQSGNSSHVSYGVYCEFQSDNGLLMKTSSLAGATSPTMQIRFFEDVADKPGLQNFSGVVPGKSFEAMGQFRSQLLFQAQSANGVPRIFFSEINLADKVGPARALAQALPIDNQAQQLASKLRISLRNYGVSSGGRYLVLPANDGRMSVLFTQTLTEIGRVDIATKNSFLPIIDEETKTLSVLQFVNGHFENRIFMLELKDQTVSLLRELKTVKPASGYSQTSLQSWPGGKLVFTEVQPSANSKPLNLLIYDPTTESAQKSVFTPVKGSVVAPWVASFEAASGKTSLVVATEKFDLKNGRKLEFATLVGIDPVTGQRNFEASYPADVRAEIERDGIEPLAISALISSRDRRALFMTLPKHGEPMVFKISQDVNGFSILGAGVNACENPSISKEEF